MSAGMRQWQLAELASKAGELLGMALDLTWDGHGVRLGTEGNGLYLSESYNQRGRIQAGGWYPHNSSYFPDGCRRHINVRADRGPRAIAAEIDRRLMPGYRETVARSASMTPASRPSSRLATTSRRTSPACFPPA